MKLHEIKKGMKFKIPAFRWAKVYGGKIGIVTDIGEGQRRGQVQLAFPFSVSAGWFALESLIPEGDPFWIQPKIPFAIHCS